jgi:hypothetical protein
MRPGRMGRWMGVILGVLLGLVVAAAIGPWVVRGLGGNRAPKRPFVIFGE